MGLDGIERDTNRNRIGAQIVIVNLFGDALRALIILGFGCERCLNIGQWR